MKAVPDKCEPEMDTMSRRSKEWPRIYERHYPSGRVVYVVDCGMQNGRRVRRVFVTRTEAEAFAQRARLARDEQGAAAFSLPFDVQGQAVKLYTYLKPHGISLADVQAHYSTKIIPFMQAPLVSEIVDRLIQKVESKRRISTVKSLKFILGDFRLRFGGRRITDITLDELDEFCFRPDLKVGNSAGTKHNRWTKVSQLYNFAIKKTWATNNLALALDAPPADDDAEPEFLSIDEVTRLLSVADDYGLLGYFVLALFLGIRPTELIRLDWSEVHRDDRLVVIYKAAAKIHERREVPIHETAEAWLQLCHQPAGPVVSGTNFQARFKSVRTAAGMTRWPKDVMRHTFATNHAAAFKNLVETARQMGHIGGLRILRKHYVAYVPERIAKEFWALTPDRVRMAMEKEAA